MSRLSKNLIYNLLGQGFVLCLSLVAVRFIFRQFGDDVFGIIWFALLLTTILVGALELGVSTTTVREVAAHFHSQPEYIRDLIRTASSLYWGAGLLLVVAICLLAPYLVGHWIHLRTIDRGSAVWTLRILSVMSLVALPRVLYASLFRGRQMMAFNNAIDIATTTVQQGGAVIVLALGGNVYVLAAWLSSAAALGVFAYIVAVARTFRPSALVPALSLSILRRNAPFTRHMMLISATSLVQMQSAQIIVTKLLPVAEFGFYGFASSMVNRMAFVAGAVAQAALPSFAEAVASSDQSTVLRRYRKLQDLVCYGTAPLFAGLCFAAVPVLSYVFTPAVAEHLILPVILLSLGTWMNATLTIPYMLSVAMGRPDIASRLNVIALFLVLPVTFLLVVRLGLVGAAVSWVIYHLLAYVYMVPRLCAECLGSSFTRWYMNVVTPFCLAVILFGGAWILIGVGNPNPAVLAAGYLSALAGFGAIAYFAVDRDLRDSVRASRQRVFQ